MDFVITTFGGGDVFYNVFNAIATLLNGNNGIINTLIAFGAIVGLLISFWYTVRKSSLSPLFLDWFTPFLCILTLVIAPKMSVTITDPVSHITRTVDNVPAGIAIIGGTLSGIGKVLTQLIEQVFSLPDDLQYQSTGVAFASNLVQQARIFHFTDDNMQSSMYEFVNNCVLYDALMGSKYTFDDLKNTDDIWRLVGENASPARSVMYQESGQKSRILTCKEAFIRLNQKWNTEFNQSSQIFGKKIFSNVKNEEGAKALFLKSLPSTYDYLIGSKNSAEQFLRQNMMIYSVVDSLEKKSTSLGNASNFPLRKAYLQQRETHKSFGALAAQTLPTLKNVFELICYVSFIFIIPFLLLPGGTKALLKWFHMILWVQMWPPLFAILNFIMNVAAAKSSVAATSGVLSIATTVGMTEANADIAAQAGYLALSVPVIAWAIIQGGVSSLSQALSYVTGVTQGVANKAGEEMVHGNMSMGNVSLGTVQAHNTTQGQMLKSPSLTSGAMRFNDGRMDSTHSADGSAIHNVGVSQLPSNVNMGETFSNAYTKMANQSATMSQQHSQAASQSESQASRQVYDFANHLAKSQNFSDSNTTNENASAQQSAKKLLSASEDFAKNHNISTNEAADFLISASAGFNFFGNGANTGVTGSTNALQTKLISNAQNYAKQHGLDKTTSHLIQASQDERVSKSDDEGKRYSEGLNQSLEKASQHRKEESLSLQKSNSFSEQAQMAKQNSTGFSQNMNQQYIEWLKEQPMNGKGPMGSQAALHLIANDPHKNNMYLNRFVEDQVSKQANYFDQQGIQKSQSIDTLHNEASRPKMQSLSSNEHPYQKAEHAGLMQIPKTIEEKTSNISTNASDTFKNYQNIITKEETEQMKKRTPVVEEFDIKKESSLMNTAGNNAGENIKESLEEAKKFKKSLDTLHKNRN
jgi:conjugal transfer mating pair stabilization protein TraG